MKKEDYKTLEKNSFLDGGNAPYLESLYDAYLEDSQSVPALWREYFSNLKSESDQNHTHIQEAFKRLARTLDPIHMPRTLNSAVSIDSKARDEKSEQHNQKQIGVLELIEAYRLLGHLAADIDPLSLRAKPVVPELMLSYHHLSDSDLDTVFQADNLPGPSYRSLRTIVQDLKKIYCGSIATEFMHIPDSPERIWIQQQVEAIGMSEPLNASIRIQLLKRLSESEGLEKYLGAKYPGAKRFSLEGLDSFMILLDTFIEQGSRQGIQEVVIGMAHRGRLNVLVNIFGKSLAVLFDEFEGKHYDERLESGDVKYHQGFSSDVQIDNKQVHLSLAFNPSHLEIVFPVICGSVRARQERRLDQNQEQVLAIGVHGDAAFAGQGVVMETLNMAHTRGFGIGGSVHIVMNNQIGFTTSDPQDSRSTLYCSDIGKMMEIPIFHVNANDPEAVYKVAQLALAYRTKFKKDLIIDLIGYRRQGHNEADEPAATQPLMYQIIRKLPTVFQSYANQLVAEGLLQTSEVEAMVNEYRFKLDNRTILREVSSKQESSPLDIQWASKASQYPNGIASVPTGVSSGTLQALGKRLATLPANFTLHPRVQKIMEERQKMSEGSLPLDWGYAEIMAYATLLNEGYSIRMTGQDCRRGTFFHRHAVLHNQATGEEYSPLANLSLNQGKFSIYDSPLSEEGVLAFEYGYSTTALRHLVIWEAQFGDFVNGAQVVIDQFISSGEQKWGRLSGLTLFLPHGYEGQGPEHSSARLERFLQLCAQYNIQVCSPSSPAQMFHLIRRQLLSPLRKPLVVMTPKSFLRHKLAVSSLKDLELGQFQTVLGDPDTLSIPSPRRLVFCSGKVYYDLLEKRRSMSAQNVVLIRVEQLYPFPVTELQAVLERYQGLQDIVWCQEEPENQGAWYYLQAKMSSILKPNQRLRYVGRSPAAAPAVGYLHLHLEQHEKLLKDALE